jgi:uncharacterized membrane protein YraQ (UPF0718 family)
MARRIPVINGTLLVLLGLLAVLVLLAWSRGGGALVQQGLSGGGTLLASYALIVAVSFLAAGFAEVLVPTEWVRRTLGDDSGLRGLAIASGAGMLTPAGPFVSMPIAAVMVRSGAGMGPVVAFLTSWSLLALHRFIAWEVPILGWRVALLRYGVCLVLPFVAGWLARLLSR